MKIVIGTLLFSFAVFVNFVDVISSANENLLHVPPTSSEPRVPHIFHIENSRGLLPRVCRYSDPYGNRLQIFFKGIPKELAVIDNFIIGVVMNGGIFPLWGCVQDQVIVRFHTGRNVVMSDKLHAEYDRYYTPYIQHPRQQNSHRRIAPN